MKPRKIISISVLIVAQIAAFFFMWDWIARLATDAGREQRGGISFGVTVMYSKLLMSGIFLIASGISLKTSITRIRWMTIALLACGWMIWLIPAVSLNPLRTATLFSLGLFLLLVGSGFVAPKLVKFREATPQ